MMTNTMRNATALCAFLLGACSVEPTEQTGPLDTDITWKNNAPVAEDDSVEGRGGMTQTIDVLANDSDADNEILHISAVSESSNGTVEIADDGWSLQYTPADDFDGTDTFTYTVSDTLGATDEATVSVTIQEALSLIILSPSDGDVIVSNGDTATGTVINIDYELAGCTGTSPRDEPDDCHLHRWIDDVKYSQFGWYTVSPINDMVFEPGEHTLKIQVIKNDGTDQPFQPYIEDEVTFTIE